MIKFANTYKVCKECKQKYYKGEGYFHRHGKNNPMYGIISPMYGINFEHSEETKRKMSIAAIGKIFTKEHRRNIGLAATGRIMSEDTKKKMSLVHKKHWKDGVYDNVKLFSYSGFRKDIGHFVRSTWEANFARILNYLRIEYEYEKYYFDTSIGTYTPDFYLPEKDIYVEVKGWEYKNSKQKAKRIQCRKIYNVKIKMIRWKQYERLIRKYKGLVLGWEI